MTEEDLLLIQTMEEAAEVQMECIAIQRACCSIQKCASKMLRFGPEDVDPTASD